MLEIDTKTGASREAVPARQGHAAIGLKYAQREDRLFVSGGPTGKAFVYDASSGTELAAFQLTAAGPPTFINDVVLTRNVAYFTDSRQPVIYAVKRDLSAVTPIPLPDFPMTEGNNLNGIEAARRGRVLLAIQSSEGVLWRIDPATGSHAAVDLHGAQLTGGDGLLLISNRTLLGAESPQPDRGRQARQALSLRSHRPHDHAPRLRRPDDGRAQRSTPHAAVTSARGPGPARRQRTKVSQR